MGYPTYSFRFPKKTFKNASLIYLIAIENVNSPYNLQLKSIGSTYDNGKH